MRKIFKDYIEKKRLFSIEHNQRCIRAILVIEHFIKLVEKHMHYKIINSRVTKKFKYDSWNVTLKDEFAPSIQFNGYINGKYEEISFSMRSHSFTPENILKYANEGIDSYKRGISDKDYIEEERILSEIDQILGSNSFVEDLIYYGLHNR